MSTDMIDKPIEYYVEQLAIDKFNLDGCIERQAGLFNEIAVSLAEAISQRDFLKKDYEDVQAEVAAEVRHEAKQDSRKMTDKAVTECVAEDKDVKQAHTDFLDAKRSVDLWAALKESFMQRSYMIKELAQLYIAGYFADKTFASAEHVGEELTAQDARKKAAAARKPLKRREK